jgi:hypothetical protein
MNSFKKYTLIFSVCILPLTCYGNDIVKENDPCREKIRGEIRNKVAIIVENGGKKSDVIDEVIIDIAISLRQLINIQNELAIEE